MILADDKVMLGDKKLIGADEKVILGDEKLIGADENVNSINEMGLVHTGG